MKQIRVYLRALEMDDYVKIHQWRNDDEIRRNFSGVPMFSSTENEKKWVENRIFDKNNVTCAVCLKETDEFIGLVFLNDIDYHNRRAHAPSFIGEKQYWGKGYASDARILILKYAFVERGLERIDAYVIDDNIGSCKMAEKTGYKKEGILRKSHFVDGVFHDEIVYGCLKEDFLEVLKGYEL